MPAARPPGRVVAGTYELSTLHLGLGVVVEVRGPVVLRVASTLQLLHGTKVQPAAGLTTAQVRWETTDRNVLVGNDVQFFGELAAPEARVDVGRDARIRGAIEAERVVIGDCAQVIGPPSGPGSPGGVDRVQRLVAYGVNALNQYTSVGGVARSHDRSGNLVDDGVRRLTWDYRNRLVAVADKASGRPIAAYAYDSGNRRVGKTTYTAAGGVDRVTRSFWDGWDLVEEQSASGTTEVTYVTGVGIDEHLQVVRTSASPQGAAVLWCAQDARGDVVAVTNASGAVVERSKFDDFGRQAGGGAQPHGFQGRYRDAETGWIYFRNRFYDPETGRFLSRDPVMDPRNVGNLYTFVGNTPMDLDPFGLESDTYWGGYFGHLGGTAVSFGKGVGNAAVGAVVGLVDAVLEVGNGTRNTLQTVAEIEATHAFNVWLGNETAGQALKGAGVDLLQAGWAKTGGKGVAAVKHLASQTCKAMVRGDAAAGGELVGNLVLVLVIGRVTGGQPAPRAAAEGIGVDAVETVEAFSRRVNPGGGTPVSITSPSYARNLELTASTNTPPASWK